MTSAYAPHVAGVVKKGITKRWRRAGGWFIEIAEGGADRFGPPCRHVAKVAEAIPASGGGSKEPKADAVLGYMATWRQLAGGLVLIDRADY